MSHDILLTARSSQYIFTMQILQSWLNCQQATIDPAVYNVCGISWAHAALTCSTRCFLGSDDSCPPGQSCFGGVSDCESNENLPPLTAEDVGLVEKSYTQEEIAILLDEEIQKERDDENMDDPNNWWCGTSWTNMLETCSNRCMSDDDCKPNSWTEGICFKTTGGPDNCQTPGIPVNEPLPEGSRWCGSTWNNMLETCSQQCESNDDCGHGKQCWEAPNTCQYIGVPVKEASDIMTLWCGVDYNDAMTSCHQACPGETDTECPTGMSCFSGSSCEVVGEGVVREGYKCGTSWQDASDSCGTDCQSDDDCESDEVCWADAVCANELNAHATSGMFCGASWGTTSSDCGTPCEVDDDCTAQSWCYWVDCDLSSEANKDLLDTASLAQPEEVVEEEGPISCNAEVKQCPNGMFVPRAPQLNCDFYPCLDGQEEASSTASGGDGGDMGGGGETTTVQQESYTAEADSSTVDGGTSSGSATDLSGWGSTPLSHVCTSDGAGNCGLCQGDCNSDEDCQDGLECFSRAQGEMTSVPGCVSGGEDDKPGMDYCYTPFKPTTTTTTTTTSTTTSTTTTSSTENISAMSANTQYTPGNLNYARECTKEELCGMCDGDCDYDFHCAEGLKCFSRGIGSVELVPGCLGLGIAGESVLILTWLS